MLTKMFFGLIGNDIRGELSSIIENENTRNDNKKRKEGDKYKRFFLS